VIQESLVTKFSVANFRIQSIVVTLLAGLSFCAPVREAGAAGGSNAVAQAEIANAGIASCSATRQGQARIDCIADVMERLSSSINSGEVGRMAPQLVTVAGDAANVRGRTKTDALRFVAALISRTRRFAIPENLENARGAILGVFARAQGAIQAIR
jgi:hypothetical protein